ncbi:hypothetical protein LXT21_13260 [Myxococcus sp. K38C18041901]|uniref:hypothetical protein n=1 Tax=Myxococcus guangdongensis TaxID=2906760 RepID=UPI0020A6F207|nr:hypothetical protein [Myxococcus guangdongensis]MCP3059748.1 hypothetical protein [Myxococcus guangdongensis]
MSAPSPEWVSALRTMRRLFEHEPTDRKSLEPWEDEAIALMRRLRSIQASFDLEEIVWHYLIDADIRVKDADYRQAQREVFESWLLDAERALEAHPAEPEAGSRSTNNTSR